MIRCNCESSYCEHNAGLKTWPYVGKSCPNPADDSPYTMDMVGRVCTDCARTTIANDGAPYIHDFDPN